MAITDALWDNWFAWVRGEFGNLAASIFFVILVEGGPPVKMSQLQTKKQVLDWIYANDYIIA